MTNDIGIYVHIPFCVRKCLYCDFNSQVPPSEDTVFYYTAALISEIKSAKSVFEDRKLSSVYIGGGTPSSIPSSCIGQVLDAISSVISVDDDTEITLEANPGTLTELKIKDYVSYGINRVSLGLQSAVKEELKALGRIHDFEDFKTGFDRLYWGGIENISVDIMTSIPYQTRESLIITLDAVTKLRPQHISAYSLMIEQNTPFYDKYRYGLLPLPAEDESYYIYKLSREYLKEKGYKRYEISNYSLETSDNGKDYRCLHNLRYWDRRDYIGFGVSAASLIKDHRFTNTPDINEYVSDPGGKRTEDIKLRQEDAMAEFMFLGLRKTEGIRCADFEECFGQDIYKVYGRVMRYHTDKGYAASSGEKEEKRFYLTDKGLDVSNIVMSDYLLT
ncbi:MAG: radical SAM family heme chaperone HemW [Lachnospiraceae bacterium]|nr:radical SAM family heme chaperone HemW [Lachnospiraceae bacterium]